MSELKRCLTCRYFSEYATTEEEKSNLAYLGECSHLEIRHRNKLTANPGGVPIRSIYANPKLPEEAPECAFWGPKGNCVEAAAVNPSATVAAYLPQERPQIHREICKLMNGLYESKNSDYGNAFSLARKEQKIPGIVALVTIFNKYQRLKTLISNEAEKPRVAESIEDTLMDLANYCIMELIERRIDKSEKQSSFRG